MSHGGTPKAIIREMTEQKELGCIIGRKRLTYIYLGLVARMNNYRRAKRVGSGEPGEGKEAKGNAEEELARYHPRRPVRNGTDVGGCF